MLHVWGSEPCYLKRITISKGKIAIHLKGLKENSVLSTGKRKVLSILQMFGLERDNRSGENSCLLNCRVYFSLKCSAPSRRNAGEHCIMRDYMNWNKKRSCCHHWIVRIIISLGNLYDNCWTVRSLESYLLKRNSRFGYSPATHTGDFSQ